MEVIHPICAGIDVHKKSLTVCLVSRSRRGERSEEIRTFNTMTPDLLRMYDWLTHQKCPIVAIESTGVYWKPVFNLLEPEIKVILVNPERVKPREGKKTDARDAQWLAQLLEHNMVEPSFIPPIEIRDLRDVVRYRTKLVEERAAEVNRVSKLLESANIRLSSVATDVMGASGRAIMEALLDGVKDPQKLAELARGRLRSKKAELEEALVGVLRPHHLHLLTHMLEHIDFLSERIGMCEVEIEEMCRPFAQEVERLSTIPGVDRKAAQAIIAEIGTEMSVFPSHRHLCSWAGICPGNNESAGKRKSGRIRDGNQYLRRTLTQCAHAAGHTKDTFLGAEFRRFKHRKGAKKAAIAVAHSILEECWFILHDKVEHYELGVDYLREINRERLIRQHVRRLESFGLKVSITPLPEAA
jgi:transposase